MIDLNLTTGSGEPQQTGIDVESIDPLIRPLIPFFAELTTERITGLRNALDRLAFDEIKRLAHTVKGSAASYGFPHFADLASRIEQALLKPDPTALVDDLIGKLDGLHQTLLAKIANEPELFLETEDDELS